MAAEQQRLEAKAAREAEKKAQEEAAAERARLAAEEAAQKVAAEQQRLEAKAAREAEKPIAKNKEDALKRYLSAQVRRNTEALGKGANQAKLIDEDARSAYLAEQIREFMERRPLHAGDHTTDNSKKYKTSNEEDCESNYEVDTDSTSIMRDEALRINTIQEKEQTQGLELEPRPRAIIESDERSERREATKRNLSTGENDTNETIDLEGVGLQNVAALMNADDKESKQGIKSEWAGATTQLERREDAHEKIAAEERIKCNDVESVHQDLKLIEADQSVEESEQKADAEQQHIERGTKARWDAEELDTQEVGTEWRQQEVGKKARDELETEARRLEEIIQDNQHGYNNDIRSSKLRIDESQQKAIQLMREGDLICIAPPGHGKTRIAVEGIKDFLLHSNGASNGENIIFLSFTRAAVREAQERLSLCSEAQGTLCMTLDSFCGHLGQLVKSRLGIELKSEGYEENIELYHRAFTTAGSATKLLREFISETIDLLVIDEAQDLTGARLDLAKAIIGELHDNAKCTVLCDPIQAIYSYREDESSPKALDAWCQEIGFRKFEKLELNLNHRAKHAGLALTTRKARSIYGDDEISIARKIKCVIEYASLVDGVKIQEVTHGSSQLIRGFHMFRRNIDALSFFLNVADNMRVYGLRLTGRGQVAHPILAELCSIAGSNKYVDEDLIWSNVDTEEIEKRMDLNSFGDLFDKIVNDYGISTGAGDRFAIDDLRNDLQAKKLPIFLSQEIIGNKESVCGSIHSFKGRESANAVLYIDSSLRCTSLEEFRVFYVGITRPIFGIEIAKIEAPYYEYDKFNKRAFNKKTLEIEIGLEGDVIWSTNPKDYSPTPFDSYQRWLREHCCSVVELEALLINEPSREVRYDIITKQTGRYVGCFNKWLTRKIQFSYRDWGMPRKLSGIFMLGTESVVLASFKPSEVEGTTAEQISQNLNENKLCMALAPLILGIATPKF